MLDLSAQKVFGIGPVIRFDETTSVCRLAMEPKVEGSLPTKELEPRLRYVSPTSWPKEEGIDPCNVLFPTSRYRKAVSEPMLLGIEPRIELPQMSKYVRETSPLSDSVMLPPKGETTPKGLPQKVDRRFRFVTVSVTSTDSHVTPIHAPLPVAHGLVLPRHQFCSCL